MSSPTTMTYGSYSFSPVPFMSLKKQLYKAGHISENIGVTFLLNLRGTLTPLPSNPGGLDNLDILQDELRAAFNQDGKIFEVKCGDTVILKTCPTILSVNLDESNNNWVFTTPFTIEMEFQADDFAEDSQLPPFIESYDENWQVDLEPEYRHFSWDLNDVVNQDGDSEYPAEGNAPFLAKVSRVVNAKGKRTFDCTSTTGDDPGTLKTAVDNALDWLNGQGFFAARTTDTYESPTLGYVHALSGILNLDDDVYTATDHFRSSSINESDGSVSMTETWVIVGDTGINRLALEDFDISVRTGIQDPLTVVSINGTIKGYVGQSWGDVDATQDYAVDTQAYSNAEDYWAEVKPRLLSRSQLIYERDGDNRLHPTPVSLSVGHAPGKGTITYQAEYNTRPCNFITGALQEDFQINDTFPTDVFASIFVLGRPQGPVLQSMDTVTAGNREVSISCVMPIYTGCTSLTDLNQYMPRSQVTPLLCDFETDLVNSYQQVFKTSDVENWSPRTGSYSRRVNWTVATCTGIVSSSFC